MLYRVMSGYIKEDFMADVFAVPDLMFEQKILAI